MSQKPEFSLKDYLNELQLEAIVHFKEEQDVVNHAGNETLANALINSNILVVLQTNMPPMPIRLANNEIYELVLHNNRGLVAKEGRANRYLVALKIDEANIIVAIGDDLDPGMVLFEFLRYIHK
jgi:hypothetical protein